MAKDRLLSEAIADAKTVKDAAIANAMLTLKEAFKPQLTSMLTAKLRNEQETMDEESVDEQKKLDSSDIGGSGTTVDEPAPKKPSASASSSSDIENPGIEQEPMGEGVDDFGGDPTAATAPAELGGEEGDEFGGEEGGDELDLEAIIRELEADLQMGGAAGGADEFGGEPDQFGDEPEPEMENWNTAQAGKHAMAGKFAGNEELEETVPGQPEDGVSRDGKSPTAKDGVNGGKEVKPGAELAGNAFGTKDFTKAKGSVDEEVDLDEILREMEAESVDETNANIASENVELKRSLREHRSVIVLLRNRINEVTLLNSKLMYTTKIFRKFNLAEDQKKKVVEQLDRATTLREAKIVFTTLAETLMAKGSGNTARKIAAKITEGASKPVASTKSKTAQVLNEGGDVHRARMQKLAGIRPDAN
jgi:hypothetical protein